MADPVVVSMHSPLRLPLSSRLRILVAFFAIAVVAAGCATRRPAPVEDRTLARGQTPSATTAAGAVSGASAEASLASTYTVKRGDTLHQIALDNGLDYRELAAWNGIENVNRIRPGQVLRLAPPGEPAAASSPLTSPVAQDAATGVTTAPLRTPPPIAEGSAATPPPGAAVSGLASPPPVAAALPASRPVTAPVAVNGNLKTSPKAVKQPYSEEAVRNLNLVASAAPAPREMPARPDANALSNPAPASDKASAREATTASSSPSAPTSR
jgi:LysM repeat protein